MREIKTGLIEHAERREVVILNNIPHHQGLVKANRFLLLLATSLMVIIFLMGFLLMPADDMLDGFTRQSSAVSASAMTEVQNPVLSAEINILKGQLVGLVSGSIESKLRSLEKSIQSGSVNASMGTIQDLKNDVRVLRSYSIPEKKESKVIQNKELLAEVSQLKSLIYLTLTSCGLMIAAISGLWVKNHYRIMHPKSSQTAELGKHK